PSIDTAAADSAPGQDTEPSYPRCQSSAIGRWLFWATIEAKGPGSDFGSRAGMGPRTAGLPEVQKVLGGVSKVPTLLG
ncbi:hypothetical protein BaRGS_00027678, partial [Batillaria attramentaria]